MCGIFVWSLAIVGGCTTIGAAYAVPLPAE